MKLDLPKEEKIEKRTITVYVIAILVCILAISIVVIIQVLGDDVANHIFGVSKLTERSAEEKALLKVEFDKLFENELTMVGDHSEIAKIKEDDELIVAEFSKKESVQGKYELNVNIPYLNIKHEVVEKYNKEIQETFQDFATRIVEGQGKNVIYTVKYQGYLENDILSLMIRADLKQRNSAQRLIIQTYHFDLKAQKEISLVDLLARYEMNQEDVQEVILKEIGQEEQKARDLEDLGYTIFKRDRNSEKYLIQNSKEFFIHNNNVYVIYAYGNDALTSEMDVVIL